MAFVPLSVVVLPGGTRASSPRGSLCSLYNDHKLRVNNVVLKQAAMMEEKTKANAALQDAYDRCHGVCAYYSKTFYLGTLLMTPSRRRAIWAIDGRHGSCSVSMAFVPLSVVVLPGGRSASSPRGSLCSLYNDHKQRVYNVVLKQAAMMEEKTKANAALQDAYDRCRGVCADYSRTFYLGTLLMTPSRRRAIWAIDVWCRRTDELVDGLNASLVGPSALDLWEARLEELFDGRPYNMFDAALSDTVSTFSIDIQPFRDMIEGMRMDLNKSRYKNFEELYLYCYYVAGTVGLMTVPVMGITPKSRTSIKTAYKAALALGIANQLTNILRDVGEDANRGRIYLPQDELAKFCLSDEDVFSGKVTDKWRSLMKNQIKRARMFFNQAEEGVAELSRASRWPVLASLILYQQVLDEIEANDYNNFTKRACVSKVKKLMVLPVAYARSLELPWSQHQKGLTEL